MSKKIKGNSGFTLIELLATIVLLSLVMGISATGVGNAIKNSKLKSEKIFVQELQNTISDYLALTGSFLATDSSVSNISFTKKK